ncbi:MAG TPA: hypothetical protein PKA82_12605 [Pyrinomonadaceae bacterium]|nr:hypothetical protein [Pyrinomonadaceae bacterium]
MIETYLSRSSGRQVEFIPHQLGSKLVAPKSTREGDELWKAFSFLSQKGRLKVSGQDFSHWMNVRELLTRGDEYTICSDQALSVLRHLEFLTGKRFTVVSGDATVALRGPITGNGAAGILEMLKKVASIEITEN